MTYLSHLILIFTYLHFFYLKKFTNMKHNQQLPNAHLRKHWTRFVKTFYNQPAAKRRR